MSKKPLCEGWNYIMESTRTHYFRDGVSLCGKFSISQRTVGFYLNDSHPYNCVRCRKRREAELSRMNKEKSQ